VYRNLLIVELLESPCIGAYSFMQSLSIRFTLFSMDFHLLCVGELFTKRHKKTDVFAIDKTLDSTVAQELARLLSKCHSGYPSVSCASALLSSSF
jgi:hypothetical protein